MFHFSVTHTISSSSVNSVHVYARGETSSKNLATFASKGLGQKSQETQEKDRIAWGTK